MSSWEGPRPTANRTFLRMQERTKVGARNGNPILDPKLRSVQNVNQRPEPKPEHTVSCSTVNGQLKLPRKQTAQYGTLISEPPQAGATIPELIRLSVIASSSKKEQKPQHAPWIHSYTAHQRPRVATYYPSKKRPRINIFRSTAATQRTNAY